MQKHVLQRFHHLRVTIKYFRDVVDFLLIHSPLMLEIPLFQIAYNFIFMFIKNENSHVSFFLLIPISVLLSPIVDSSSLVFFEHVGVDFIFKLVFVLVENRVQFKETFWQKFDALDLINCVFRILLLLRVVFQDVLCHRVEDSMFFN